MERYSRIYLFDDCDGMGLNAWDQNTRKDRLLYTIQLLRKTLTSFLAPPWEIIAYWGDSSYQITSDFPEKTPDFSCQWLEEQSVAVEILDSVMAAAEKNSQEVLFLVDWSMSNVTWNHNKTATFILDKLDEKKERLKGTVIFYTSCLEDGDFKDGYERYFSRFSGNSGLRCSKLMWRWNDIESTLYTLRRILQGHQKLTGET